MAFCPNCGASVEGRFCAKCGTPLAEGAASAAPPPAQAPAGGLTDNVAGLLCYVLGLITGIVFLAIAPYNQNRFVRFHAFQAIFFHLAWIALWVFETILAMILPWTMSVLLSLLGIVIWLGGVAVWILLMVKAYQGQKFQLPVIGDLAEKQA